MSQKSDQRSTLNSQHTVFFQLAIERLVANMQHLGRFRLVIMRFRQRLLNQGFFELDHGVMNDGMEPTPLLVRRLLPWEGGDRARRRGRWRPPLAQMLQ